MPGRDDFGRLHRARKVAAVYGVYGFVRQPVRRGKGLGLSPGVELYGLMPLDAVNHIPVGLPVSHNHDVRPRLVCLISLWVCHFSGQDKY